MLRLIFILILLTTNAHAITFNATGTGMTFNTTGTACTVSVPQVCEDDQYVAAVGDGYVAVGSDEVVNAYRGMYWAGETLSICSGSVHLTVSGDISAITYKVSVWSVDVTDNLSLDTELGSVTIAGSSISTGWNDFTFGSEILATTGVTAILISRNDPGNASSINYIQVRQNYDTDDEDSRQWNIHYKADGDMAGRGINDEDQPEYYTCDWVLNAYEKTVEANTEYPNIPEDISTSAASSTSILISWYERGQNNVTIDYYNIYSYNTGTGVKTLVDTSDTTSYTHTGLDPGTYTYVITAVSTSAKEGYHSLDNGSGWQQVLN